MVNGNDQNSNSALSSVSNSNDNSLLENGLHTNTPVEGAESPSDDQLSRDVSRASSVEKEEHSNDTMASNDLNNSRRRKRTVTMATNKRMTASVKQLNNGSDVEEEERPRIRTVIATDAATGGRILRSVSETSNSMLRRKKGRPPRKGHFSSVTSVSTSAATVSQPGSGNQSPQSGLNALHDVTMKYIEGKKLIFC